MVKGNIENNYPELTVLKKEDNCFLDGTYKNRKKMNPNRLRVVSLENSWTGEQEKNGNDKTSRFQCVAPYFPHTEVNINMHKEVNRQEQFVQSCTFSFMKRSIRVYTFLFTTFVIPP